MAEDDADESPTLLRRQLGRFLREARDGRGLSIANAAKAVQLSFNALQRLETGRTVKPRKQDVRELCSVYEVSPEKTEQAVDLARRIAEAKDQTGVLSMGGLFSDAFNIYVDLERYAQRMTAYTEFVPGLLQTEDYARAIISAFPGYDSPEDIDRRVQIRMARQAIVTRKTSPLNIEVLMHESALHRAIGGSRVMTKQLQFLLHMSTRDNVTLRIHPYSAGMIWGFPATPFVRLDFGNDRKGRPIEPPVVYIEGGVGNDAYIDNADLVRRYAEYTDAIRRTTLDDKTTRDRLRLATRE